MARTGRPGLSFQERAELWRRWRAGQSFSEIAVALGKAPGSIFGVVRLGGGFSPATRQRSSIALTLREREEISRGISAGESMWSIASALDRAPSTVSRGIGRHGGVLTYRAAVADTVALEDAQRPKVCRLASNQALQRTVAGKLKLQWSPEQIAGWLKITYPNDEGMRVSHETIYKSLFIQARGALKKELQQHLRSGRLMRHSEHASTKGTRSKIADAVSIRDRPAEIEDRAVPGHWEGDLISVGYRGS
jgi:IS30 family transposase